MTAGRRAIAIFVISIWMAWIVTAGVAELWLRTEKEFSGTVKVVDAQRAAAV